MNLNNESERIFPLDAPVTCLEMFRAAGLATALNPAPASIVMGNRAFIRRWAARRAAKLAETALAVAPHAERENRSALERRPFTA